MHVKDGKGTFKDAGFRVRLFGAVFSFVIFVMVLRLAMLMIVQHGFYAALAAGTQEAYARLFPRRGDLFFQDSRTGEEFPLAINQDVFTVFADTREFEDDEARARVLQELTAFFSFDDEKKEEVRVQLAKRDDPYEPIAQNIDEEITEKIRALDLPGIGFARRSRRFYPEARLGAAVVGFVAPDQNGGDKGRYGVEGYWNTELAGQSGFLEGARGAKGSWIPLAGRSFQPAQDGADILLTLDRTIQYVACERLLKGMHEYGATSASLIVLEPHLGAVRAMCSFPDFDPNKYGEAQTIEAYNNTAIFTPYEPGSIFKPLIMAAALQEEAVEIGTVFHDTGLREGVCSKPIRNAAGKSYGDQTMTGVLENSINTGMIYVAERLGKAKVVEYINQFGMGLKADLGLDTEASGNIESLYENKGQGFDCYTATASFGQGITVTPLQMANAFAAIANGGELMQPYIVDEMRRADGRVDKTRPRIIRKVLDKRTASLVSGMLVRVVDYGHARRAGVKGYYVGGKTGTAQIPGPGGYTEDTNHTLVGFAPVDDPKFVMVVKYEKPQREFAESTAGVVFGDIAKFILEYYGVPPGR